MTPNEPSRDPVEDCLKKTIREDIPADVEARLRTRLSLFRQDISRRPASPWHAWWMRHRVVRTAAAMACAAMLIVAFYYTQAEGAAPTWAQVNARFAAVPFINATIYVKNGALDEPVQLELWMSQGGLLRMRAGNQVIFGKNGRAIETLTLPGAEPANANIDEARQMVQNFIAALGGAETFSFDTLVKAMPGKQPQAPPLPNQDASVARDLAVFDMVGETAHDWVRIWALRESRLPVRVLFWEPALAASVDVQLSYFNEQPAEFFDPEAFKASIAKTENVANQAYSLLKDPGGRPWTPDDITKQSVPPKI